MTGRQDLCEKCSQKDSCKEVYRQLGRIEPASVTVKVIVAFLLPVVILICSLAFFQYIAGPAVENEGLRTALCLFLALVVTAGYIIVVRLLSRDREGG